MLGATAIRVAAGLGMNTRTPAVAARIDAAVARVEVALIVVSAADFPRASIHARAMLRTTCRTMAEHVCLERRFCTAQVHVARSRNRDREEHARAGSSVACHSFSCHAPRKTDPPPSLQLCPRDR